MRIIILTIVGAFLAICLIVAMSKIAGWFIHVATVLMVALIAIAFIIGFGWLMVRRFRRE